MDLRLFILMGKGKSDGLEVDRNCIKAMENMGDWKLELMEFKNYKL
jgi:hypothetical protein